MIDNLGRITLALTGRYRVERLVGTGGMATVYLAEDERHHRRVAVKVLRPELSGSIGVERFEREIGIAARLNHPHILPLLDSGTIEAEHGSRPRPITSCRSWKASRFGTGSTPGQEAAVARGGGTVYP